MTAEHLRILLNLYILVAIIIAITYLARRRLSIGEWLLWGTVIIAIPVLGPFIAISAQPGPRKRKWHFDRAHRRKLRP